MMNKAIFYDEKVSVSRPVKLSVSHETLLVWQDGQCKQLDRNQVAALFVDGPAYCQLKIKGELKGQLEVRDAALLTDLKSKGFLEMTNKEKSGLKKAVLTTAAVWIVFAVLVSQVIFPVMVNLLLESVSPITQQRLSMATERELSVNQSRLMEPSEIAILNKVADYLQLQHRSVVVIDDARLSSSLLLPNGTLILSQNWLNTNPSELDFHDQLAVEKGHALLKSRLWSLVEKNWQVFLISALSRNDFVIVQKLTQNEQDLSQYPLTKRDEKRARKISKEWAEPLEQSSYRLTQAEIRILTQTK